jgi:hypothetical protein
VWGQVRICREAEKVVDYTPSYVAMRRHGGDMVCRASGNTREGTGIWCARGNIAFPLVRCGVHSATWCNRDKEGGQKGPWENRDPAEGEIGIPRAERSALGSAASSAKCRAGAV